MPISSPKIYRFKPLERTKDLNERVVDLENAHKAMINLLEDFDEEQKKLAEGKAKNEAILANIGDGLVATDKDGKIIEMNHAAGKLLGLVPTKCIGKQYNKVWLVKNENGKNVSLNDRPIQTALTTGKKITTTTTTAATTDYFYVHKDGTKFPTAITVTPVILNDQIIGAVEVFRDITKEKQIEKAKNEFVSLASHQLRTPPSIIGWYTETLESGDLGPVNKKQAEYLKEIDHANQRMIVVINSLLNISRIEMGTFLISPKEINIKNIIDENIKELTSRFNRKAQIKKDYSPNLELFNADPNIIDIIVDNLLSNSFKYSPPENTKIEITAKKENDSLLLSVKDNGVGIPANNQNQIFEKLFRADNAVIMNPDGTGLGLYMIKKIIVEGLGGEIWFHSEENKGTTFSVTIPISSMEKKRGTTKLTSTS